MTTTKIGLDDISAIADPEGRAVALALFNKLPRWIEITDDPATWAPTERLVVVRYEGGEESFGVRYVNHSDRSDYKHFKDVCNVQWDREGQPLLYFDDYDAPRIYDVTHWRPI